MAYSVEFVTSAAREFKKLERRVQKDIGEKIEELKTSPRPHGVEKLTNADGALRIRMGDYRIVYEIQDKKLLVLVLKIGHRKEVYKR